ncbi:MAG: carboxylating nicotinate-nucleotide diphosphorylase [Phycisphaerae bacterium]|nr:carboxylating nicotinate-nucleotide diphosphorylase [Phycisphaerae bacterium]
MQSIVDLNRLDLGELFAALVDERRLDALIEMALAEDLGSIGDVTTSTLVAPTTPVRAAIVARGDGVIAGLPIVMRVLEMAGANATLQTTCVATDGQRCRRGETLVAFEGLLATLLPLERTMLNFLGRLCGVATLTHQFVEAVHGTKARICCTRKTLPGWREIDKYAVRCGGGTLHRIALYDAMLVKDNHLGGVSPDDLASVVETAARAARRRHALRFVEVEVDTLPQFDVIAGISPGIIDIVLLDNFSLDQLAEAVRRRDRVAAHLELEASGGVRLETVRPIAETGVERISCGAITHSAVALDVAIDLVP